MMEVLSKTSKKLIRIVRPRFEPGIKFQLSPNIIWRLRTANSSLQTRDSDVKFSSEMLVNFVFHNTTVVNFRHVTWFSYLASIFSAIPT